MGTLFRTDPADIFENGGQEFIFVSVVACLAAQPAMGRLHEQRHGGWPLTRQRENSAARFIRIGARAFHYSKKSKVAATCRRRRCRFHAPYVPAGNAAALGLNSTTMIAGLSNSDDRAWAVTSTEASNLPRLSRTEASNLPRSSDPKRDDSRGVACGIRLEI